MCPLPLPSLNDSPRSRGTAGAALRKPKAFSSNKIMPGQRSSPKAATASVAVLIFPNQGASNNYLDNF